MEMKKTVGRNTNATFVGRNMFIIRVLLITENFIVIWNHNLNVPNVLVIFVYYRVLNNIVAFAEENDLNKFCKIENF